MNEQNRDKTMRFITGTLDLYREINPNDPHQFPETTGYGITPYPSGNIRDRVAEKPHQLKSGDLVTVFSSVTKGDIHWEGEIDMEALPDSVRGVQKNIDPKMWGSMFFDGMPAQIRRGDKIYQGGLDPFCETGTEGIIWSIHEFGKFGYEGLIPLRKGDVLTVFKNVTEGKVEFFDKIIFDNKPALWGSKGFEMKYPPAPKSFKDSADWLKLVLFKYPVIAQIPRRKTQKAKVTP